MEKKGPREVEIPHGSDVCVDKQDGEREGRGHGLRSALVLRETRKLRHKAEKNNNDKMFNSQRVDLRHIQPSTERRPHRLRDCRIFPFSSSTSLCLNGFDDVRVGGRRLVICSDRD